MSNTKDLGQIMRGDWDRRIRQDYRFWMSDGYQSDDHMWSTGLRDFEVLTRDIANTKDKNFLEVGCGIGRLLRAASNTFKEVIGLDVSNAAIEKAKIFLNDSKNVNLVVGNGLDLSTIPSSSIDVVGVFAALSSAPTEAFVKNLIEIQRVLKVGGVFRLQFYTGSEQIVGREDTLHLRCYEKERFEKASILAGFDIEWIEELKLDVETSYESIDVTAQIASLIKSGRVEQAPFEIVMNALVSHSEQDGKQTDGDIEYWMSLNLAETAALDGDTKRARDALNYALSLSKTVTIDVSDVLERIVTIVEKKEKEEIKNSPVEFHIQDNKIFEKNLEVLQKKNPLIAEICRKNVDTVFSSIETPSANVTQDGPVFFLNNNCLDHPQKPKSAGIQWAKRSLAEVRIKDAKEVIIVGFGGGYHVEACLESTTQLIGVVEPSIALFVQVMKSRDITTILEKLNFLAVGEDLSQVTVSDEAELLIRPQSLMVAESSIPKIKEKFYGVRGLKSLHPNIVVLGPMQGGTLPILGYTGRALQSLGQRTREIDMSPFNAGYDAIQNMLREPRRLQTMHSNYIECMSQSVLEAVIEKKTDILICMAQAPVTARVLQECKTRGIITVLWFVEDYMRFTYWREMAKHYDFVFTIQKGDCIDSIKKAGAGEVHYMAPGCDPIVHHPQSLTPDEIKEWGSPISFVGAGYHNRQQVFASFAEMPFKLWGTEWPGCKPFDRMIQKEGKRLTPEEYTKIFCGTDININLHSSTERDGVDPFGDFVNPRTFELACCEAFQLVDERSLLGECFIPGKELVTFNSPSDLKEKIAYYLERPDERKKIARAGRERVLREHTYAHRLRDMLSIIYSSKYEHLRSRSDAHPWKRMLERTKSNTELHERCQRAFERGEEPKLDGLIVDILVGQGKLTETEQKLLFLHHVSKQIIRMKQEEMGSGPK
jgi:spore maturation protein CgeB